MDFNNLRTYIRKYLLESNIFNYDEDMMGEERIANTEAREFVAKKENFVGSHCFGEKMIGKDGEELYAAYSYDVPAFIHYKDKWYHNVDDYINDDGSINSFHKERMKDMRPVPETHGLSGRFMEKMVNDFIQKNDLPGISHTEAEPGVKN